MWLFSKPVRWGAELERAVFMGRTLSSDWLGYPKLEFLEKMPGTWGGCVAEDLGLRVTVRNPERYQHFEFDFAFSEEGDMHAVLLIIRGLQELDSLFICFGMDGAFCGARPQEGRVATPGAKRAVAVLGRKYHIREMSPAKT